MNEAIQGTGTEADLAAKRAENDAGLNPHARHWEVHQAKSYPGGIRCAHTGKNIDTGMTMNEAWQWWFDQPFDPANPPGGVRVGGGGFLQRTGQHTSGYMRDGLVIAGLTRDTDLEWLAKADPALGAEFKRTNNFDPA